MPSYRTPRNESAATSFGGDRWQKMISGNSGCSSHQVPSMADSLPLFPLTKILSPVVMEIRFCPQQCIINPILYLRLYRSLCSNLSQQADLDDSSSMSGLAHHVSETLNSQLLGLIHIARLHSLENLLFWKRRPYDPSNSLSQP